MLVNKEWAVDFTTSIILEVLNPLKEACKSRVTTIIIIIIIMI